MVGSRHYGKGNSDLLQKDLCQHAMFHRSADAPINTATISTRLVQNWERSMSSLFIVTLLI